MMPAVVKSFDGEQEDERARGGDESEEELFGRRPLVRSSEVRARLPEEDSRGRER